MTWKTRLFRALFPKVMAELLAEAAANGGVADRWIWVPFLIWEFPIAIRIRTERVVR
jgi:hypothetical protein